MIKKLLKWLKCKFCCYSKCEIENPKYKEGSIIPKNPYNLTGKGRRSF